MYKSWNRYVDDIFCIVKEKHLDDSLKLLNIQDKNKNFTMEIENNNYLPFLDFKIMKNNKKLEFGIFRKDTNADNYIKANSYNPVTHKHAIFNSLAVDKKIKAQNRLKNIKNNITLETLTKKDTIYKKERVRHLPGYCP